MAKNTKPKPEEFARQVLWHICGLRSETRIMLHMFSRHIEPDIKKADQIYSDWIRDALKIQKSSYRESMDKIPIDPLEDQDSQPSED